MRGLKVLIYDHLKSHYPAYVHKGDLEKMSGEWGYMADNICRRTRELCNVGVISKILNEKGIVLYRYNPQRATDYKPPKAVEPIKIDVSELPEWRAYAVLNKQESLNI